MHKATIYLVALFISLTAAAATLKNQLREHASPYLAMHGHDPVHWQEWNTATIALAKKENKLLYVSSGYFSCHWCHVMQRESYQNPVIAKLLNDNFIPVKVDRELSASLDARLIDFVEKTQGYSGWPLNVFITPEGYPLVGMVYVPPDNFIQILSKLKEQWQSRPVQLKQLAMNVTHELTSQTPVQVTQISRRLIRQYQAAFLQQSMALADEIQGGFGEANKFPSVPQLTTLLEVYQHTHNKHLYHFLQRTFEQMASQGLYDHLDGGFFRYVVDPSWQLPHFEKMLYDNVQLSALYLKAASILKQPQYLATVKQTLRFIQTQMHIPDGGLITSLSAIDSNGIEGGYYVWDKAEIKKLLSPKQWRLARARWGLQGAPELEQGYHLVQASSLAQMAKDTGESVQDISQQLQHVRDILLKQRQARSLPKDKKVLAGWNGLALSTYIAAAKAGLLEIEQVRQLKNYIQTHLWDGHRLYRMKASTKFTVSGNLEDYAYVSQAMLDWARWQGKDSDWQFVQTLVNQAWQNFYRQDGWTLSENSLLKFDETQPLISDGAMPSPAAVLIKTSLELAHEKHNQVLQAQAVTALSRDHDELRKDLFWHASYLDAMYSLQQLQILK